MWTLLREISLRHLRFSPLRTGLVVAGIALGVCMFCAVLITNQSLVAAFEDMVDRVAGRADLTVAGSNAGIPSTLTSEIAEIDGVEHAAAMLEITTRSADGKGGSLLVLGVDFLGDTFFLPFAQEGEQRVVEDPLAFANDPTAILVSKRLAEERGLALGDTLPLMTTAGTTNFVVKGLLDDTGPAASFGGQVVVMFLDAAQVSFSRGYAVDRIDVVVSPESQLEQVRARIQQRVQGVASVELPQGRAHRLLSALWAFRNGLSMSGFMALTAAMFLIYNAVAVSVAQRRKESGTLRALGVTRGSMTRLFCLEALVMALVGSLLGLALAEQLAGLVLRVMRGTVDRFIATIHAPPPALTVDTVAVGMSVGLLATLLAAYLPARVASRAHPADALRASRATVFVRALPTRRLASIGVALMLCAALPARRGGEVNGYVASCVLLVGAPFLVPLAVKLLRRALLVSFERSAGIPGRLALDNAERALGRSAITVIALMLAAALSMSVGAYSTSFERSVGEWIDDAVPGDAAVTVGSPFLDRKHMPFDPEVLARLKDVPGVAAINAVRSVGGDVRGRFVVILSSDTTMMFEDLARRGKQRTVIEGPGRIATAALAEAPRVLISENLSRHEDLHPGDRITVASPSGAHELEVYAVVVDYSSDQGWMMMDRKWFQAYWQDRLIDSIDLSFAPGADGQAVLRLVRERLAGMPDLFVTTRDKLRVELRTAATSVFAYARAPELITLIVAVMGVISTMLAAVLDRVRELGMLRAIGATRRQVTLSLTWESGFLGLSAALTGLLVGVPMGWVVLKVVGTATSGWSLPYVFPLATALRVFLLITTAALIAGYAAGSRAAKLDINQALSFD